MVHINKNVNTDRNNMICIPEYAVELVHFSLKRPFDMRAIFEDSDAFKMNYAD